jgi:hypothetical protein
MCSCSGKPARREIRTLLAMGTPSPRDSHGGLIGQHQLVHLLAVWSELVDRLPSVWPEFACESSGWA